jgi:hypothetical protein
VVTSRHPTTKVRASDAAVLAGAMIMMPYDTYRLYQVERTKSAAEVQRADEQAARFAAAASSPFRGIMRPARAVLRPYLAAGRGGAPHPAEPACRRGKMVETMEGS